MLSTVRERSRKGNGEDSPGRGTGRRRAGGVLGAVGPLGGPPGTRQPRLTTSPSARQRGAVSVDVGLPGSWGLLGSRRVPAGLVEAHRRVPAEPLEPIPSRSTTELGEGGREVGGGCEWRPWTEAVSGGCGRAGCAGARTERSGPERERTFPTSTYLSPILLGVDLRRMGERYVHATNFR